MRKFAAALSALAVLGLTACGSPAADKEAGEAQAATSSAPGADQTTDAEAQPVPAGVADPASTTTSGPGAAGTPTSGTAQPKGKATTTTRPGSTTTTGEPSTTGDPTTTSTGPAFDGQPTTTTTAKPSSTTTTTTPATTTTTLPPTAPTTQQPTTTTTAPFACTARYFVPNPRSGPFPTRYIAIKTNRPAGMKLHVVFTSEVGNSKGYFAQISEYEETMVEIPVEYQPGSSATVHLGDDTSGPIGCDVQW